MIELGELRMGRKYCSVRNCKNNSEDGAIVMHIIRKEWINIVDWKTSTPSGAQKRKFLRGGAERQFGGSGGLPRIFFKYGP